jgi:hypothetical protein
MMSDMGIMPHVRSLYLRANLISASKQRRV